MKKNRDYTGLERTPSSLVWLINERSRTRAKLDRCIKLIENLPGDICELMDRLASLDRIIPLHEVQVKASTIEGKRRYTPSPFKGHNLVRTIVACLKQASGKHMLTTMIVYDVAARCGLTVNAKNYSQLKIPVIKTLAKLVAKKKVLRHHSLDPADQEEGCWSMPVIND